MSDFILLGGLEMRSDLKKDYAQRNTERAGQTEKALYLLNTISAITDRVNITVRQSRLSGVARATCPD